MPSLEEQFVENLGAALVQFESIVNKLGEKIKAS
jgi:hypothetical protein